LFKKIANFQTVQSNTTERSRRWYIHSYINIGVRLLFICTVGVWRYLLNK